MPIIDGTLGFEVSPEQLLAGVGGAVIYDFGQSEGPHSKSEDDRTEHARRYICEWSSHELAIRGLIGFPRTTTAGGGSYVRRFVPHSDPTWVIDGTRVFNQGEDTGSGTPYLYCTSAEWWGQAPVGKVNERTTNVPMGEKSIVYDLCRIDATYQTLPYDILTDAQMVAAGYVDGSGNPDESKWRRYVLVNPKPSGEFFSIASGSMLWCADGIGDSVILQQGTGRLLVYANLAVTRYGVPATSMPSMHVNPNLRGVGVALNTPGALELGLATVNDAVFNGYAKGTLLLTAIDIRPKRSAFGLRVYDYTTYHKFLQNYNAANAASTTGTGPYGHNYIFRPRFNPTGATPGAAIGRWTEVTVSGVTNAVTQALGQSIYNWYDHAKLYRNP